MRYLWLRNHVYAESVLNWFKDSTVVKEFSLENKGWVNGLTSSSIPTEHLLNLTATVMAKDGSRAENGL
jgi:hypothetical protein